jgi:hypothetical protein
MIHGHAKVLDGQSTNDAARLGFCTLGLAVHDRFRIGICRGDSPIECWGSHVNHEQKGSTGQLLSVR